MKSRATHLLGARTFRPPECDSANDLADRQLEDERAARAVRTRTSALPSICVMPSTQAPAIVDAHLRPKLHPLHPVPSDPRVCTSPVDAPDPELRNNSCRYSGVFHHPDRASL